MPKQQDKPTIIFQASVNQVRTLADGGIRLVLDLPEDSVRQAAMLMECKREGIYLKVQITGEIVE
jgi:hypothetical protein